MAPVIVDFGQIGQKLGGFRVAGDRFVALRAGVGRGAEEMPGGAAVWRLREDLPADRFATADVSGVPRLPRKFDGLLNS